MSFIFVGLGNPGEEYENTRHNTGRMFLEWFGKDAKWKEDKNAKTAKIKNITLILPATFMNNSGKAIKDLVKNSEKVIVIYDDLDLPFGTAKMSFNKSSGGHRGVESIIKALKTQEFARIRIGISPKKKPRGEEAVIKHIMGKFKPNEITILKKISKKVNQALETFTTDGLEKAMSEFN